MRPILLTSLLCLVLASHAPAEDVANSADHPLITRYPESLISYYDEEAFVPYRIAVGLVTSYRQIDEWREVAGQLTRINYDLRGERSFFEVHSNYVSALNGAGFEALAEGHVMGGERSQGVGSRPFINVHYAANPVPPGASRVFQGSATSGGSAYYAGRLSRPEGDVYAVLTTSQHASDWVVTLMDIIEAQPMEDDLVKVDADYMAEEIQSVGKVVLYGILFEHDSATIKPESAEVVGEIAKLLAAQPELAVYVVGHSDSTGSLDYNLRLSRERAASVVDALVADHGIARERLDPHGVGPLVPVANNAGDAGRGKNRRVELVER